MFSIRPIWREYCGFQITQPYSRMDLTEATSKTFKVNTLWKSFPERFKQPSTLFVLPMMNKRHFFIEENSQIPNP